MKHLGDICKINGAEVEPVSVIIGGSPCQDLSVAGKRAGLDGARSGLFMEQIRVIKEMRENDRNNGRTGELCRPRYMVWENVPGAFSSNSGEDFRTVLEETARVADQTTVIPRPPKGRWANAGAVMGDGWSIAWRVLDAQFWGVPQRRRRIALVADFGGQSAPEILFKSESLSGNIEQSGTQRERTAADAESCTDKTICYGISAYESNAMKSSNPHSGVYKADTSRTLDNNGGNPACNQGGMAIVQSAGFKGGQSSGGIGYADEQAPTLQASPSALEPTVVCLEGNGSRESHKGDGYKLSDKMYTLNTVEQHAVCCLNDQGGSVMSTTENITSTLRAQEHGHQPIVYDARGNGNGELAPTITGDHQDRVTDYTALCIGNGQMCNMSMKPVANSLDTMHDQQAVLTLNSKQMGLDIGEIASTLGASDYKEPQAVMTYGLDRAAYNQGKNAKYNFSVEEEKIGAQTAKGPGAVCTEKGELYETETRNPILRLLWETYGAQAVVKWGIGVLDALQQTEILRQGMYESSVSSKTENRDVLGGNTPICPSIVAEWLLRDMREQQENGSTSQRRQSSEQQHRQFDESMPELPQQTPQTCEKMFDMWSKGKGLRLLRQTLSEIQEIWESANGERQSAYTYSLVRRLTPLEAERLQGYPDGWTDIGDWTDTKGKTHKAADSPRYKALGNSIAVPCWRFILQGISERVQERTMASLFDGIGGFPLIWEEINGSKSCRWVSEIEEFPIAVTKMRFEQE